MSKLLIEEQPLQVLPKLAEKIGLNEAIVLQQVHYWLRANRQHFHDGRFWCYNSVRQWKAENFPFWSEDTIKRVLKKLRALGLLLVANFNRLKIDQTLWYTIDYEAVDALEVESPIGADCPNGNSNLHQPIPETTTEGSVKAMSRKRAKKGEGKLIKQGWGHAGGDNLALLFSKKPEPDPVDWKQLDDKYAELCTTQPEQVAVERSQTESEYAAYTKQAISSLLDMVGRTRPDPIQDTECEVESDGK